MGIDVSRDSPPVEASLGSGHEYASWRGGRAYSDLDYKTEASLSIYFPSDSHIPWIGGDNYKDITDENFPNVGNEIVIL